MQYRQERGQPCLQAFHAASRHPVLASSDRKAGQLTGAAGHGGALLDAHQPFVLAQALADLACCGVQVRGCPVNIRKHCFQHVFAIAGLLCRLESVAFLALQFLQQLGFQVGAAGYFKIFKQGDHRGMVIHAMIVPGEVRHACEQDPQGATGCALFRSEEIRSRSRRSGRVNSIANDIWNFLAFRQLLFCIFE